jgi:small-conductance mechanosensitive channel/CRP-like cAMP-binding protein
MFRDEMAIAMAVALGLGIVLLVLRPGDRARTRNVLLALGAGALAEAVAGRFAGDRIAGIVSDAASVFVGLVVLRLSCTVIFRVLLPACGLRPARIGEDLTTVALFIAWGLVCMHLAGVDTSGLITTSAVITGVLAFALKDSLENIFGGVILQLDRSIRVGDWVKLDDLGGRVVEIGWRHTAVETRNRETVVVPNGYLMKNRFLVIGSRADPSPLWRRWVHFNIELGRAPGEVCAVLEKAVTDSVIAGVAETPAPNAVLLEVKPRFGHYALRYWLTDPQRDDPTDSEVRTHVMAALTRNGMRLGIPFEERLLAKDNEAYRTAEQQKDLERRQAALRDVDLFKSLTQSEIDSLATHLVRAPFVKGDTITKQGAVAHWLYLIVKGVASVCIDAPAGRKQVATLLSGSVFGEMGMMTGEARRATVIAQTDVECYRLDKEGFRSILQERPDIAGEISRVLIARAAELDHLREEAAAAGREVKHEDILARIRGFFGLSG